MFAHFQLPLLLLFISGLTTVADAGIMITLTDNGDDTIGFSMSGDFTVYASGSAQRTGLFGTYLGPNNGTISNAETTDSITEFNFAYADAGGDAGGAVAAAFGSGGFALYSYSGSGHVFQNFTSQTFFIDQALTSSLTIGGAVTGGVISGVSASGTYAGSFASVGITAGTVVTQYGSDASNYDTVTITRTASTGAAEFTVAAVPEPSSLAVFGFGAGLAGTGIRRRRR